MEGRTGLRRTWSLSEGHIMHRCGAVRCPAALLPPLPLLADKLQSNSLHQVSGQWILMLDVHDLLALLMPHSWSSTYSRLTSTTAPSSSQVPPSTHMVCGGEGQRSSEA